MRVQRRDDGHDDFWPAYTDILMVTCLVLILLVVTFVITRPDNRIKEEQERRKNAFVTRFNKVMTIERGKNLVGLHSPPGERQIISFSDQMLFDKGDAALKRSEGRTSLTKLSRLMAEFLGPTPGFKTIKVNGHTDEDAIHTTQFPSNWHLSSARATSVVYFLVQHGIAPGVLSATGFAEFRPVDPLGNVIREKAKKRRIEIELLYPEDWIASQVRKK